MIRIQNSVVLSHSDVCYSFLRPIMSSSSGTIKWMGDYISDIQHLSKRHMERLAGMQNTVASHNVPTYGKKLMERMGWSAEQSMDVLSIPESDRNSLAQRLK